MRRHFLTLTGKNVIHSLQDFGGGDERTKKISPFNKEG